MPDNFVQELLEIFFEELERQNLLTKKWDNSFIDSLFFPRSNLRKYELNFLDWKEDILEREKDAMKKEKDIEKK